MDSTLGEQVTLFLAQHMEIQSIILSIILIGIILILQFALRRLVKGKREILDKDQRRWLNLINNASSILILVALIFIWAPQIHTFALSLTAIAVAIVITTKELLMCLTGGFLRAATKPFGIGDWITVDNLSGEVMKITALGTVIEEIDTSSKGYHFTGRTIQIPNSRFLNQNIENANFIRSYVYHEVPITIKNVDQDPQHLMEELQKIAETHYAPFRADAVKFNKKVEKKAAVDFDDPDPQFFLRTKEENHLIFTIRMFVPTRQAAKLGTDITRDFIKVFHDLQQKTKAEEE